MITMHFYKQCNFVCEYVNINNSLYSVINIMLLWFSLIFRRQEYRALAAISTRRLSVGRTGIGVAVWARHHYVIGTSVNARLI